MSKSKWQNEKEVKIATSNYDDFNKAIKKDYLQEREKNKKNKFTNKFANNFYGLQDFKDKIDKETAYKKWEKQRNAK